MSTRLTILNNLKSAIEAMTVANGYNLSVKSPVLFDVPHSGDVTFDVTQCVVAINDLGPDRVITYFEGNKVLAQMTLTIRGFVRANRGEDPGQTVTSNVGAFIADFKDLMYAIKSGSPSLGANFRFMTWDNMENQLVDDTEGHIDITVSIVYWYTRGSA